MKKGELTPPPEQLSEEDFHKLEAWHIRKWPQRFALMNNKRDWRELRAFLRNEMEDCFLWHEERGIERKSWLACVQRWVKRTYGRTGFAKQEPRSSAPSPKGRPGHGRTKERMTPISKEIGDWARQGLPRGHPEKS